MRFHYLASMRSFLLLCVLAAPHFASSVLPRIPDHGLGKRQTSSSGITVDFQVTEPVLTPSGTNDQYGCVYTKVLMEHDFAYSYGAPFVGAECAPSFCRMSTYTTPLSRELYTASMQLQPGDYELHRYLQWPSIRPIRAHVLGRY